MKKTHKIIMGLTALAVAFSAFTFTACSSGNSGNSGTGGNGDNGSGAMTNYQVATAEEINEALSNVNQQTLFGDTTAEGYKFGIDVSASFNASVSKEDEVTNTLSLSAGYQLLSTKSESLNIKGAGNFTMKYEDKTAAGNANSQLGDFSNIKLDLYQNNALFYVSAALGLTEADLALPNNPTKFMIDFETLIESMLTSTYVTSDSSATLPEGIQMPDLSSMDLTTAINMLNEMGATVAMDTNNGIKLRISITEDMILELLAGYMGGTADGMEQFISFSRFKFDIYLGIDSNGQFGAASLDTNISVTIDMSEILGMEVAPATLNLRGSIDITVDPTVTPAAPADFNSTDYADYTILIPNIIQGLLGNISG